MPGVSAKATTVTNRDEPTRVSPRSTVKPASPLNDVQFSGAMPGSPPFALKDGKLIGYDLMPAIRSSVTTLINPVIDKLDKVVDRMERLVGRLDAFLSGPPPKGFWKGSVYRVINTADRLYAGAVRQISKRTPLPAPANELSAVGKKHAEAAVERNQPLANGRMSRHSASASSSTALAGHPAAKRAPVPLATAETARNTSKEPRKNDANVKNPHKDLYESGNTAVRVLPTRVASVESYTPIAVAKEKIVYQAAVDDLVSILSSPHITRGNRPVLPPRRINVAAPTGFFSFVSRQEEMVTFLYPNCPSVTLPAKLADALLKVHDFDTRNYRPHPGIIDLVNAQASSPLVRLLIHRYSLTNGENIALDSYAHEQAVKGARRSDHQYFEACHAQTYRYAGTGMPTRGESLARFNKLWMESVTEANAGWTSSHFGHSFCRQVMYAYAMSYRPEERKTEDTRAPSNHLEAELLAIARTHDTGLYPADKTLSVTATFMGRNIDLNKNAVDALCRRLSDITGKEITYTAPEYRDPYYASPYYRDFATFDLRPSDTGELINTQVGPVHVPQSLITTIEAAQEVNKEAANFALNLYCAEQSLTVHECSKLPLLAHDYFDLRAKQDNEVAPVGRNIREKIAHAVTRAEELTTQGQFDDEFSFSTVPSRTSFPVTKIVEWRRVAMALTLAEEAATLRRTRTS